MPLGKKRNTERPCGTPKVEGKQFQKPRAINWHEACDKPRGRPHKHVTEIKWREIAPVPRGGYSPTIPTRVCAARRGRDFGTPDLERGIHLRDVSWNGV